MAGEKIIDTRINIKAGDTFVTCQEADSVDGMRLANNTKFDVISLNPPEGQPEGNIQVNYTDLDSGWKGSLDYEVGVTLEELENQINIPGVIVSFNDEPVKVVPEADVILESYRLDNMKTTLIPTGLYGKDNLAIFDSLAGQLSDGMWENSSRMTKYWEYMDYQLGEDDQVMIRVPENYRWWLGFESPSAIKKWIADHLKALVKEYIKYNEGEWSRDCTIRFDGWFHRPEPEIREVYRVYDKLLGRKDRVGSTYAYLEDYNSSDDEHMADLAISWLFDHDSLYEAFCEYFDYYYDENTGDEINKPDFAAIDDWIGEHDEQAVEDYNNYMKDHAPEFYDPETFIEGLGGSDYFDTDLGNKYLYALQRAEKLGILTYTVSNEDDPKLDAENMVYEEFDTWEEAKKFAQENNIDRIIVNAFGWEGPNGYDNGDYVEFDEQWFNLNHELLDKESYLDNLNTLYLENLGENWRPNNLTTVYSIEHVPLERGDTYYKVRSNTSYDKTNLIIYITKKGFRVDITSAIGKGGENGCASLMFKSIPEAQEFLRKAGIPGSEVEIYLTRFSPLEYDKFGLWKLNTELGETYVAGYRLGKNELFRNISDPDTVLENLTEKSEKDTKKSKYFVTYKGKGNLSKAFYNIDKAIDYCKTTNGLYVIEERPGYEEPLLAWEPQAVNSDKDDDLEEDYYDEPAVKVAKKIAKALKLSKYDLNTLIHDINNLRGSEWLQQVESIGDEELLKQFKEVAQLDLEEDIEKHDTLNPKLFDGEELKPEVKETIVKIVDQFISELANDGIKFSLKDIVLLGSNVSYNYTKDSDLDIHLIADSSDLTCPDNLYPLLYSAYRSMFNNSYNITINGIPAEIYVEMDEPQAKSNGIYSLNTGWIKKPTQQTIPNLDKEAFDKLFTEWEDRYFKLLDEING